MGYALAPAAVSASGVAHACEGGGLGMRERGREKLATSAAAEEEGQSGVTACVRVALFCHGSMRARVDEAETTELRRQVGGHRPGAAAAVPVPTGTRW